MFKKSLFVLMLSILLWSPIKAHDDTMPYIYYYSDMLGGLIVEHPDGTDSRHIGQNVIPALTYSGLGGAGWSPSGDYFAAYGVSYEHFYVGRSIPYIIDTHGNSMINFDSRSGSTHLLEWSPNTENLLFLSLKTGQGIDYFVINLNAENNNYIVATFGVVSQTSMGPYLYSEAIDWRFDTERIIYYYALEDMGNYRVTIDYFGNVQQESISAEIYREETRELYHPNEDYESFEDITDSLGSSPSGDYEIYGDTLVNRETLEETSLPQHSEATGCGHFRWNNSEEYILMLHGTLRAGGGCYEAVFGITNREGTLWRELGVCSWDTICVNWLPPQVNIDSLPAGQERPIQLDPVAFEPSADILGLASTPMNYQLQCGENWDVRDHRYISPVDSEEILFELSDNNETCPYVPDHTQAQVAFAYSEEHQLLATYWDGFMPPVSIWRQDSEGIWQRILWLNTAGYELEFSADGSQLRARTVSAWKIYNVSDILLYAGLEGD